jgi:caffeoyl-CoA O-methyltransferase
MSARSFLVEPALAEYLASVDPEPTQVEAELIAETRALGDVSNMQIGTDQAAFMNLLTKIRNPKFVVEVGTFTGYSSLTIAKALTTDAKLLCCDVSEEWTSIARRYWERAGVAARIELQLGPALDTLNALPQTPHVDMAFIDADKPSYRDYYEALIPRMTANGIILVDNTLWSGRVVAESDDANTTAIRDFNKHVASDGRVESVVLTIGDGLTLIRVRERG